MTATPGVPSVGRGTPLSIEGPRLAGVRWLVPVVLLAGLAAIVAGRWWATRTGFDPLAVGALFGLALGGLALAGRQRSRPPSEDTPLATATAHARAKSPGASAAMARAVAGGIGFGLVLVAIVLVGAAIAGAQLVPGLARPAADLAPWAAVTVVVACAEEALLRGRLFDAIRRAGGVAPAVLVTTIAFALMHVPLYGWHVVPLDLAVGLGFAGLRLATGSVVAPAAAHSVADLATWWL